MSPEASPSARSKKSSAKPGSDRRQTYPGSGDRRGWRYVSIHEIKTGRFITHGWWPVSLLRAIERDALRNGVPRREAITFVLERAMRRNLEEAA